MGMSSSDDEAAPTPPASPPSNPNGGPTRAKKRRKCIADGMPRVFRPSSPPPQTVVEAVRSAGLGSTSGPDADPEVNVEIIDCDELMEAQDEIISSASSGSSWHLSDEGEVAEDSDVEGGEFEAPVAPSKHGVKRVREESNVVGVEDTDDDGSADGDESDYIPYLEGRDSSGTDGEIDEDTEPIQSAPDAAVALALSVGGKDVEQRNARYFMMDNVVCSHCGIKGHMSFDCTEEASERRCFLCGKPGHNSHSCPDEACFYCNKPGHRQRDCPTKTADHRAGSGAAIPRPHHRYVTSARPRSPPHTTRLFCYVCGKDGHVDCSLAMQPRATLSCGNCGTIGHAASGCPEPPAERWVSYVNDLQREKRATPGSRSQRGAGTGSISLPRALAEARIFKESMCNAVRNMRGGGYGGFGSGSFNSRSGGGGGGASKGENGTSWRERNGSRRR
jgi:cellular nucleic acid-binding protein